MSNFNKDFQRGVFVGLKVCICEIKEDILLSLFFCGLLK
jgi:hypothetical protein